MFITEAWAQAGGAQGGGIESMVLIVVMFGVLYFMMIRPQMKRAKEHKTMIEALQKGDEVISGGGVLGRVSKMNEQYISVEIATGVEVQMQRSSVQLVLPKGTLKNL
ncbi:MAG: preprotein translocase subunit YajC [Betaproteobacteria bacterium]|jgi:preprotein translocase subunit YajC